LTADFRLEESDRVASNKESNIDIRKRVSARNKVREKSANETKFFHVAYAFRRKMYIFEERKLNFYSRTGFLYLENDTRKRRGLVTRSNIFFHWR